MAKVLRMAAAGLPVALAGITLVRRRRNHQPLVPYDAARHRVLVLGGGFGGFTSAVEVARRAPEGTSVLLIDRQDFLTFWPMVPEVIPGSIEVQHALRPLAGELVRAGVNFVRAEVEEIDVERMQVRTTAGTFDYHRLVIALGWQTNFYGVTGAQEHAIPLEAIGDAIRIRDHVIDQLEAANARGNLGGAPEQGRLSFVVVGGGSTGVEVAANLRSLLDLLRERYPAARADDLQVHLLQAKGSVLPHMDKHLERVAAARLRSQEITVHTRAQAAGIDAEGVTLTSGERIPARTVIWAAGVQANAISSRIRGLQADDHHRLPVDPYLRLAADGAYALGDIAAVSSDGKPVPPTAQAAVQEAACLAANLVAELSGGTPEPFRYRDMGQLVDLGSRFAVSQVMGRRVSGALAQLLWRGVYLFKLGSSRDRARVLSDWLLGGLMGPRVSRLPMAGSQ